MIYLGADHRGFKLKEKVKEWLHELGEKYQDEGAFEFDQKDDYTLYAEKVAVLVKENKGTKGILICGSGVGADIVANKFDGVRASVGKSDKQIKAGRNDDDMNILVLAADYSKVGEAKKMLNTFLKTKFGGKKKYRRRLSEIKKIEANN